MDQVFILDKIKLLVVRIKFLNVRFSQNRRIEITRVKKNADFGQPMREEKIQEMVAADGFEK